MPPITFSNGLASGLDTQAIIDALLQAERRPAVLLESRVAQRTGQVAALKGLSALLVSLDIEADRLSRREAFDAFAVTSSDDEVAVGEASAASALGSYTMTVGAVAQAQALISQGFAAASDAVGSGSVTIQVGSEPATTVTVGAGSATLAGLRDAINAASADVTASIINTGSGATPYRLILTSKRSGASNQIAFTANLTGGTKPIFSTTLSGVAKGAGFQGTATFTNVGPAVKGSYLGMSSPTSAGSYTGASSRTYTFTAQGVGVIGGSAVTFNWSDGAGKTGSVVVPASYTPGTEIAVDSGVTVKFSAGTVLANDAFTIAATGRGTYTGTKNKTYTFTVATGGTLGTDAIAINWADGIGGAGTLNVPSSYALRSQIAVADGVVLALDGGTLVANDAFSIAVTTPILQAAQDASITLGSPAGGGNPISVTSATNDFEDLVEGLTVTVKKASATAVTLDISQDTEGVRDSVTAFVERYNGVVDFLKTQLAFDPETGARGPLFGDPALLRVDSSLRRLATSSVAGAGAFKTLSAIGVSSDQSGRLVVDEAELTDAIESDLAAVRDLFATVGATVDSDVRFLDAGQAAPSTTSRSASVAANGYAVLVTRAAEQGRIAGAAVVDPATTPIVISAANNVVRVRVNGVLGSEVALTEASYASGDALAGEIESKLNADTALGANLVDVVWVPGASGTGHFEVRSARYGSGESIAIENAAGSAWTGALGFSSAQLGAVDSGVDVAGTIDGEAAHGDGQVLIGGPEDPDTPDDWHTLGMRLLVTLTPTQLAAQGGAQGTVRLSAGVGSLFARDLERMTDATTGTLSNRERMVNRQIDALTDQIERIDERVERRARLLTEQFARLERAISGLQAQGEFLTSQIAGLSSSTSRQSGGR
jgi:flagellar hook-associated protein 2